MMATIKRFRHIVIIIIVVAGIFLLARYIGNSENSKEINTNSKFESYAGSVACANCHKNIFDKNVHTEHYLTLAPVTHANILGSFKERRNVFAFDESTNVTMEKRDSGFFQVEYNSGDEVRKGKFDMVVGSGRKGQSYLAWKKNWLVQLPITYFSPSAQWSNSPGYPPNKIVFNRPITSRCLECHSTYFEKISDPGAELEQFDHKKIIYAVDCEKCHGPGARHVSFQYENPLVKEAKFIVNPGKLSRQLLLDLCTLCHGGGQLAKVKPSFQFEAGDSLSTYFRRNKSAPDAVDIDVHGNQMGLLSLSKCFTMSSMTCISCHNTHENENGKTEVFSQRCTTCHSKGHIKLCKLTDSIGSSIKRNCIDCHMPKQESNAVSVFLQGNDTPTPALMRTHLVKIYPNETKKVLAYFKKPW